ncbi:MAG: hypothetical protein Q9M24_08655 [Mariprofundaceae bacterium]|nr:hypothetical protein [Mariprofundaceae bacterium]
MYKKAVHSFIGKTSPNGEIPDGSRQKSSWRDSLGTLSGATLLAFLTRLLCPACWPAYAGLLTSMGLGFLLKTIWLLPLTMITLVFVIGSLAFRARARRGYGPFILGLLGSGALLGGQFVFTSGTAISEWGIDGGAVLLVAASVWNGWPRKRKDMETDECPSCSSEILGA